MPEHGVVRAGLRSSPTLDGINATAITLMAGVSLQLAGDATVDTLTIAAIAAFALWRTPLNSAWLITAGATMGAIHSLAT